MSDPDLRRRLRGVLHRNVLPQIAAQVPAQMPDGSKVYLPTGAWKAKFREWLAPHVESTEDLSDSEFHRFILAIESMAATRMNVTFQNRSEQT